jgi:hypothetical protein
MIEDVLDIMDSERSNLGQRAIAGLGLLGLALVWALALLPCALWLAFNLAFRRDSAEPRSRTESGAKRPPGHSRSKV